MPIGRSFVPSALGMDVHAPDGGRSVGARLEAIQQRLEVQLQVRRVVRRRLAIHADHAVLARPPMRFAQEVYVDEVGERRHHHLRRLPRQFRYPLEFR